MSFTFTSLKRSLVTELFLKATKQSSSPLYIIPFRYPGTHIVFCSIFFLWCRRGYQKKRGTQSPFLLPFLQFPFSSSAHSASLLKHPHNSMRFYSLKDSTNHLNVIIQECWQDTPLHTTIMKLIYHSVALVTASYEFLSSNCFVAFFTLYCTLP